MSGGFEWAGSNFTDPDGKIGIYSVAASHSTKLAVGDVVVLTGTADADEIQQVDAATAGADVLGVIVGFVPDYSTENFTSSGLAASTAGKVYVNTDPRAEYMVDCDETLAAADVGLNANIAATEASLSGGLMISNMEIDSSTKAATATLQFRIVKRLPGSDGTIGDRALVRLNESSIIAGALGV